MEYYYKGEIIETRYRENYFGYNSNDVEKGQIYYVIGPWSGSMIAEWDGSGFNQINDEQQKHISSRL